MTTNAHRWLTGALVVVALLLAASTVTYFAKSTWQVFQTGFACSLVRIFDDMHDKALATSDPREAAECLAYTVHHYPAGSVIDKETQLEEMVELARANAVEDIIARLRELTLDDLGDDANAWIEKYKSASLALPLGAP